ncbi:MAG TPA: C13 family peptidase [Steroidobacteraceae bacterium]|nr:C13 family peptidase [Steroidobacteraceae bacterium]
MSTELSPKVGPLTALRAILRLWALRPVANLADIATERAVSGLACVSLALWVGLDRVRAGSGAEFQLWDTLTVSIYALLVLGLAFTLSRCARPRIALRSALFVVAALLPIVIAVSFLIDLGPDDDMALAGRILLGSYALAYLAAGSRSLAGRFQVRATLASILLLGAFFTYSEIEELSAALWAPAAADEEDEAQMPASVAETLLFDQRAQIDQAVEQMSVVSGNAPAVFFVGFAGVASQRVFAEEIKLASRVVGKRFAVADRKLLLVNDRRDLDTYPIATAAGLKYALAAVADRMNTDRDILFLALSSHGSPDSELAVSNGTLPLEQLSVDDLRAALSDSGIKRRIIVISACYAGSFIDSLKNPDTIVIAAAAANKTSFGCSDDRDLTYFGEAFYRDALPTATTLEDAFERTKAAIAAREREEHETPSEPQAFFGENLRELLEKASVRGD